MDIEPVTEQSIGLSAPEQPQQASTEEQQQQQQDADMNEQPVSGEGQLPEDQQEELVNETMDSEFKRFRYFVGHTTKFGGEYLEFEIQHDGTLRYANNSNYRRDAIIKKQLKVSPAVIEEVKRLIVSSMILLCDDQKWPEADRDGRQELEIMLGATHISFETNMISQQRAIDNSNDPEGLRTFFYLVQEVKDLVFDLLGIHFKLLPV